MLTFKKKKKRKELNKYPLRRVVSIFWGFVPDPM